MKSKYCKWLGCDRLTPKGRRECSQCRYSGAKKREIVKYPQRFLDKKDFLLERIKKLEEIQNIQNKHINDLYKLLNIGGFILPTTKSVQKIIIPHPESVKIKQPVQKIIIPHSESVKIKTVPLPPGMRFKNKTIISKPPGYITRY